MAVATWLWKDVASMIAETEKGSGFSASMEHLFDPQYRLDGKKPPEGHWPEISEIDVSKIPPGLNLVGDQGIYLMSNSNDVQMVEVLTLNGRTTKRFRVAYCRECNPDTMPFDEWYAAKQLIFGGDDGGIFLDLDSLKGVRAALDRAGVSADSGVLAVNFTATSISLSARKE